MQITTNTTAATTYSFHPTRLLFHRPDLLLMTFTTGTVN